ncbi:MAG: hypothetical protein CMO68_06660 [Verrucomicrobiales bacterium]|nr:hypothetical protein [Verrucomicrobiales bacterium]
MTLEIGFVLAVMVVAMVLFALGRFPADLVALGVLLTLFFSRVITLEQALGGFSNEAVVAIGSIFVVSTGLQFTGVADRIGQWIRRISRQSESRLILVTMLSVAGLSAVMNAVGAVAVLLPAVISAARSIKMPVSRALMPLAIGSLLGNMLTLVGTPSNMLTSAVLQQYGYGEFGLFEFTVFGAVAVLLGSGLVLIGRNFLVPTRLGSRTVQVGPSTEAYRIQERLFEAIVSVGSNLEGRSLKELNFGERFGISVLAVEHAGKTTVSPGPRYELSVHDCLVLSARETDMEELQAVYDLDLQEQIRLGEIALTSDDLKMAELVPMPRSEVIGRTISELAVRERFGAQVLAVWRDGMPLRTHLGQLRVEAGDALLVHGSIQALTEIRRSGDFVVVSEEDEEPTRRAHAPVAIVILLAFVLAALFKVAPIAIIALTAAIAMVLSGCVTMVEARNSISWRSILLIAAMLSLAEAMVETGSATFLGEWATQSLGGYGVLIVLGAVMLIAFLVTQVMGNHVTVVLMAPLAIDAAAHIGSDPRMFAMGVALAATSGFASPYAHPSNLLIMGPGNYRFFDYVRIGVPVGLLTVVASVVLLMRIY